MIKRHQPSSAQMKPTKKAQFWMFLCLVGAGFSYYLVDRGIPQGLFLGFICILSVGKYIEKHYPPRKRKGDTVKHWREEYILLKGWDNMTDIQRHVFTKKIKSSAMKRQGTAMLKELEELKAKHPYHQILADIQ